jgi:hypothetical protein
MIHAVNNPCFTVTVPRVTLDFLDALHTISLQRYESKEFHSKIVIKTCPIIDKQRRTHDKRFIIGCLKTWREDEDRGISESVWPTRPSWNVILCGERLFTAVYHHSTHKDFIYYSRCRRERRRDSGIKATRLARVLRFRYADTRFLRGPINNALLRILYFL